MHHFRRKVAGDIAASMVSAETDLDFARRRSSLSQAETDSCIAILVAKNTANEFRKAETVKGCSEIERKSSGSILF